MAWAMTQQLVTDPAARHVLLCLCNYAGDTGRGAFPSTQTLTRDTGMGRRTVQRKLDDLEAAGLIVRGNQAAATVYIDRPDRRPVVYDIMVGRGVTVTPREDDGVSERRPDSPNGVSLVHERGVTVTPNPPVNPPVEARAKDTSSKLAVLFPGVSIQVLTDWQALRKGQRAAITETVAATMRREAEKAGMTLEAVLIECCNRGWRGFKAEWVTNRNGVSSHAARERKPRVSIADRITIPSDDALPGTAVRVTDR